MILLIVVSVTYTYHLQESKDLQARERPSSIIKVNSSPNPCLFAPIIYFAFLLIIYLPLYVLHYHVWLSFVFLVLRIYFATQGSIMFCIRWFQCPVVRLAAFFSLWLRLFVVCVSFGAVAGAVEFFVWAPVSRRCFSPTAIFRLLRLRCRHFLCLMYLVCFFYWQLVLYFFQDARGHFISL